MTAAADLPVRSESDLRRRQRRGDLRVRSSAAFRALVAAEGLAAAYGATDVVVAANAEFTDQASLLLGLGPADPPIRLSRCTLGSVAAQPAGAGSDLVLPIGGGLAESQRRGGAQVLAELLQGNSVDFGAVGEVTPLQPRREFHTRLSLERIGQGRLLLHRAIGENGLVAISSAEGVLRSAYGPLLGPFANGLHTCRGADSIGLAMPGLSLLGPGSPVLVAGAIGWVMGSGSGHQPRPRRLPSGHARTPGMVAAVCADLHDLDPAWIRPCFFEGHGSALLVALAAPIPLINGTVARQAAVGNDQLEAPVLDVSIPRRLKPSFGGVPYSAVLAGRIPVSGRSIPVAPSHSPRLADAITAELVERLEQDRFPLRLPVMPLSPRPTLIPLEG